MIIGRSSRHVTKRSALVFMSLVLVISGVIFAFRPASATSDNIAYSHQIGTRSPQPSLRRSAIASDGTLWIVNSGTPPEIIHVSAAGERIGAISHNNQYSYGVAIDSSGNVYMLSDSVIFVFDSSGNYLSSITLPFVGSPTDIAIDSQNNIYVSYSNYQVKKYDGSGNELLTIGSGSPSANDGDFNYLSGIFIDSNDHLYVADTGNDRIQTFDSSGNFINKWFVSWPQDIAVQGGQAYATFNYSRDVQINNVSTGALVDTFAVDDPANLGASLSSIAIGNDGTFYLSDSMQLFLVDSSYNLVSNHELVTTPEGGLYDAYVIAKDSAGNIYAYDNSPTPLGNDYRQVQKYMPAGQFIESISIRVRSSDGQGNDYYAYPRQSFQIDNDGNLYFGGDFYQTVFDGENIIGTSYAVAKYGPAGGEPTFIAMTSDHNEDYSYYYNMMVGSILVDPETGNITVAANVIEDNHGTSRQYLGATFDADGSNRQWLGDPLPADGSFLVPYAPYDLVKGVDGYLYFVGLFQTYDAESSISTSYLALRTDSTGHNPLPFIQSYAVSGDIETDVSAFSVGTDRNGNIYIGGYITRYDLVNGIQIGDRCTIGQFSINGEYLRCIVELGDGTNQEDIANLGPGATMIIDQYGNIYALDSNAGVVKVYLIETAAPTSPLITSTNSTKNSITITWDPPADDGNTSITNYVIRARQHGTDTWFEVAITDGAARSFAITGINGSALNPDTNYDIQIIARNAAGDSLAAETSAVTGANDQAVTPTAPNTGF